MEEYAKNVLNWLQWAVSKAEKNDPELVLLKERINQISENIKIASDMEISSLLKQQTMAINALVNHVSK